MMSFRNRNKQLMSFVEHWHTGLRCCQCCLTGKKPTPPLQCLQRRTATQAEWKRGGVKWIISEFFMFEAGVFCVYFNNLEWVFFCQDPLSLSVINRKWELYYLFILFGLPLFFFSISFRYLCNANLSWCVTLLNWWPFVMLSLSFVHLKKINTKKQIKDKSPVFLLKSTVSEVKRIIK